jgi:hypothetical protein
MLDSGPNRSGYASRGISGPPEAVFEELEEAPGSNVFRRGAQTVPDLGGGPLHRDAEMRKAYGKAKGNRPGRLRPDTINTGGDGMGYLAPSPMML